MRRVASLASVIRNASMMRKLLLVFCLVSLTPLLLTAYMMHLKASAALENEVGAYTVEIAKQTDNRLSAFIQETDRIANMIRFDASVMEFMRMTELKDDLHSIQTIAEIRKLMDSIGSVRGYLAGIYLINDHGLMVYGASDRAANLLYDYRKHPLVTQIQSSSPFRLYPPHPQDYTNGQPVLSYAGRLFDLAANRDTGTLLIDIMPAPLEQMISDIRLGTTGYVFVMTADGRKIRDHGADSLSMMEPGRLQEIQQKPSGHYLMESNGQKTLVGYYTSEATGWKIVGVVPFDEVAGGIRDLRYAFYLIVALSCLVIFIAASFFAKAVTTPLKRLQRRMVQVEKGDFSTSLEVETSDEIGQLGRRFNRMLEELERMREEIFLSGERVYKLDYLRQKAELKALQAQINPHFLYNTLNTITSIGEVKEVEEVSEISHCLASMFKYSISGGHFALLSEELAHVDAYLRIIRYRFGSRISCRINVEDSLTNLRIVKLIIQPLVENAIKHGLEPKPGGGSVEVHITGDEERLIIRVTDDGVGIPADAEMELNERLSSMPKTEEDTEHIGLCNVRQRLNYHYGRKGTLRLTSLSGTGTVVEMSVPCRP